MLIDTALELKIAQIELVQLKGSFVDDCPTKIFERHRIRVVGVKSIEIVPSRFSDRSDGIGKKW